MTILDAAQDVIKQMNAPAAWHSVWIATEPDETTKEFKQRICVAVRPAYKSKVKVPTECKGFPVVQVPWPRGS